LTPDLIPAQIDLLPSEVLLVEKPANCVIRLSDFDLSTSWWRALMPLIGMGRKEAIGGRLSLTNYRLIFQAHDINRVQGTFSIFLPTIRSVQNTSVLIVRKIQVATRTQAFEFILWGIPAFMTALRQAQTAVDHAQQHALQELVAANLDTCVESTEMRQVAEALIRDVNRDLTDAKVRNSFAVTQVLNIQDLLQLE
jgi:hypothetical protein